MTTRRVQSTLQKRSINISIYSEKHFPFIVGTVFPSRSRAGPLNGFFYMRQSGKSLL
jgi:hypothetical protein